MTTPETPWKSVPKATPPGQLEGTPEQSAIWDVFTSSNKELVIDALAGSGKTTTCINALHRIATTSRLQRHRVGFCAFSKAIATELTRKVPPGMEAGTLHSFMVRILRQAYPGTDCDFDKVHNATVNLFPGAHWRRGERWAVKRLVGLCKNEGVDLADLSDPKEFTTFVHELNTRHTVWSSLTGPGNIIPRTKRILEFCADLSTLPEHGIDFDDMLWLPYIHDVRPIVPYDRLIIDEAQDINTIQMHNALSLSENITIVGDRHQAIFGFRGADVRAIDNFKEALLARRPTTTELPLTVCWRCPTSVLELAQVLVPAIQPAPRALPGTIRNISTSDLFQQAAPGHMILCRTNAPLIRLLYSFWKQKRRAYIQGRKTVGAQLLNLITQIIEDNSCQNVSAFDKALYTREDSEVSRVLKLPDGERRLLDIRDRFSAVREIALNCQTIDELKTSINKIFSDDDSDDQIRLSSIHRAKGLEAPVVHILEPHLLPHPSARLPWESQQEKNLAYVAVTRAQDTLNFVGDTPNILCRN